MQANDTYRLKAGISTVVLKYISRVESNKGNIRGLIKEYEG
jgi:hypothetical protein